MLKIDNLHVDVAGTSILNGINLEVKAGEVHAIMGPNGSGKSTLSHVLAGRDGYDVTQGSVTYDGKDLLELAPEERAREGVFLAFQYPVEIAGVNNTYFLKAALNAVRKHRGDEELDAFDFLALVKKRMSHLDIDPKFLERPVNAGFSGGEKKRNEILQMAVLEPKLAILDETDSGLDIDALKIVSDGVNALRSPNRAIVLITHYQRLLDYIVPDRVHVLADGRIAHSGDKDLALKLESKGYAWLKEGHAHATVGGQRMSSPGTEAYVDLFRGDDAPSGWQRDLRSSAMQRFAALGFPTTRSEDWRYTNLKALTQTKFSPVDAYVEPDAALLAAAGTLDAHRLVFVNGRFAEKLSDIDALPDGVSLRPVARLLHDTPGALAPHLAQVAPYEQQPLIALNTALFNDGAALHVGAGVQAERAIHLVFVSHGESTASYPRILITMEPNSRATVLESHVGKGTYLSNAVTEIDLGDGAHLDLAKLSHDADAAHHVATTHVRQARDSQLQYAGLLLGSKLTRNALHVKLDGPGAHCQVSSLNLGRDRQHVDSPTLVDHATPHCTSDQLIKSILDDHSSSIFDGKVIVRQGADKTDAIQQNRNLLLAKTAVANTRPQLEIYADDVKCSHGATVGQLDETALFYLRSRGLDMEAARGMLTYSFGLEVVERMQQPATRKVLRAAARTWLNADAAIEAQS